MRPPVPPLVSADLLEDPAHVAIGNAEPVSELDVGDAGRAGDTDGVVGTARPLPSDQVARLLRCYEALAKEQGEVKALLVKLAPAWAELRKVLNELNPVLEPGSYVLAIHAVEATPRHCEERGLRRPFAASTSHHPREATGRSFKYCPLLLDGGDVPCEASRIG